MSTACRAFKKGHLCVRCKSMSCTSAGSTSSHSLCQRQSRGSTCLCLAGVGHLSWVHPSAPSCSGDCLSPHMHLICSMVSHFSQVLFTGSLSTPSCIPSAQQLTQSFAEGWPVTVRNMACSHTDFCLGSLSWQGERFTQLYASSAQPQMYVLTVTYTWAPSHLVHTYACISWMVACTWILLKEISQADD